MPTIDITTLSGQVLPTEVDDDVYPHYPDGRLLPEEEHAHWYTDWPCCTSSEDEDGWRTKYVRYAAVEMNWAHYSEMYLWSPDMRDWLGPIFPRGGYCRPYFGDTIGDECRPAEGDDDYQE